MNFFLIFKRLQQIYVVFKCFDYYIFTRIHIILEPNPVLVITKVPRYSPEQKFSLIFRYLRGTVLKDFSFKLYISYTASYPLKKIENIT